MTNSAEQLTASIPQAGESAPAFDTVADNGEKLSLQSLQGKKVVLYFYPKDNTPGCTTEAEAFRDHYAEFQAAGAEIIGVSKDSVKKHCNFRDRLSLPFPLISDEDDTVCERYGVWQEKKMYGKSFMGISRTTFLIDGQGKIAQIWEKVKVKGHAEEVLAAAKEL
jgi:peroxiredoxin Q/BCP